MKVDEGLMTMVGYKMAKNINHLVNIMLIIAVHIVCYYRNVKQKETLYLVVCLVTSGTWLKSLGLGQYFMGLNGLN